MIKSLFILQRKSCLYNVFALIVSGMYFGYDTRHLMCFRAFLYWIMTKRSLRVTKLTFSLNSVFKTSVTKENHTQSLINSLIMMPHSLMSYFREIRPLTHRIDVKSMLDIIVHFNGKFQTHVKLVGLPFMYSQKEV